MTAKNKKAKRKKTRTRPGRVGGLHASVEDHLLSVADREMGSEARWNRLRKQRISLRVDVEMVDWFKSKGPGYQTRMNRVLRRVMMDGKKRMGGVEVRNRTLQAVCLPHSIAKNAIKWATRQTALREWAYATHWRDSSEINLALPPWNHYYNYQRPHGSLNYQPPISRSEPRTTS